jgi:hypothetical protein
MAQPAWPQLQEISVVSPASSQYGLQYLVSSSTTQLQAGWAHCLIWSDMIVSPLSLIKAIGLPETRIALNRKVLI